MDDARHQFAMLDKTRKGSITRNDAKDILLKLHGESLLVDEILPCFVDSTDFVRWVELLAFIACCSTWYTIRHLYHIDQIRKKQGNAFHFWRII